MKDRIVGRLAPAALAVAFSLGLAGCGGGIEEGLPQDIDMTKDYTPAAPVGMMKPDDQKKAGAQARDPNRPMAATPGG